MHQRSEESQNKCNKISSLVKLSVPGFYSIFYISFIQNEFLSLPQGGQSRIAALWVAVTTIFRQHQKRKYHLFLLWHLRPRNSNPETLGLSPDLPSEHIGQNRLYPLPVLHWQWKWDHPCLLTLIIQSRRNARQSQWLNSGQLTKWSIIMTSFHSITNLLFNPTASLILTRKHMLCLRFR